VTTDRRCTFSVRAFAKVNLSLRVLDRRSDGYHTLETTFQSLKLHDTLTFRTVPGGPFGIECDDPDCPVDRANLVWRAAELAWQAAGRRGDPAGLNIRLAKRIPMQAGLGGGSSDAAATLRGCAALWRVSRTRLLALAPELGADVPFFVTGGTALGVDRGDRLTALPDHQHAWVVLLVPSFGVSTKEAYAWFDEDQARRPDESEARVGLELPRNDLEHPVSTHHPDIARMVGDLERAGSSLAAMSGSGSAVFGLFPSRVRAVAAGKALGRRGRRAIVTETLGRAKYRTLSHVPPCR
jgi:4-diphosphocytidyl-2-C-methyl-D-erythritol kinase